MNSLAARAVEIVVAALGRPLAADATLSTEERARAARLRLEADRSRFIAVHATLRELLGARCHSAPASLIFHAGAHGKPRLAGSSVQFSLSYSGALAAYAFARGRAVGIDVEAVRPIAGADAIAARVFPATERRAYAALAPEARVAGFLKGWTRTEALAKALGGGLGLAPAALDAALEEGWGVRSFAPAPGFEGAVACRMRS